MKRKIRLNENQKVWFLSDTHFRHANIIKYDNLLFKDIDEHDEVIINNYNSAVNPSDFVFFLGDFCMGNVDNARRIYNRLSGNITFIRGNHDKPLEQLCKASNKSIFDLIELSVYDDSLDRKWQSITLCHYPIAEWNKGHYGAWHLYGHTHGNSWYDREMQGKLKCRNVGVNCLDFKPISYDELKRDFSKLGNIEHH